jgi:hypothetical protein
VKIKTDDTLKQLVRRLAGLAEIDARRLVRKAIYDDGAITRSDLVAVMTARYELTDQGGALSLELETAGFADIGGLEHLKPWLTQRRSAFVDTDATLDTPKGILLIGVQGGAALYRAREQGAALANTHVLTELGQTRPLSRVMAERVQALRTWARDRTVVA